MQDVDAMNASLRAFSEGLIDYAGLFPPAGLDMQPAITNFLDYRAGAFQQQLGSFVIPAARLSELDATASPLAIHAQQWGAVPFSVLAGGGSDTAVFHQNMDTALKQVEGFLDVHGHNVRVSAFEIRLPDVLPDAEALPKELTQLIKTVHAQLDTDPDFFFELKRDASWPENVGRLTGALASVSGPFAPALIGFKLRCGGVKAEMFPSVAEVACAIHSCVHADVPLKATAGLHHPVRHFNAGVQTRMHGYFNVFGAIMLAKVHGWNPSKIEEMLADEHAAHFIFDVEGFAWKHFRADLPQIRAYRAGLATSYGSCSFAEPLEDLHTLGLLSAHPQL
ncbi:hypothetical protein CYPRO_2746 [Cyclonatronum proteinivorum]|uniref:Uncharacterized protein n=1 Tax=Cyclonatronum proteinivorum TaxID=1457365 RepID=A0A345UND3_9BACT|nr:hypothetical protein [Cyclonatronum proteinivorum]AXJ01985.1 hypothetical protein CYPRO_2746 [Cyclonatronum proteinivorum]